MSLPQLLWYVRTLPPAVRNGLAKLALQTIVATCSDRSVAARLVPLLEDEIVRWVRSYTVRARICVRVGVVASAGFSRVEHAVRGPEVRIPLREIPALMSPSGQLSIDHLVRQSSWPIVPMLQALDLSDGEAHHRLSYPLLGRAAGARCTIGDPLCTVCQRVVRLLGGPGGGRPEFLLRLWDQARLTDLRSAATFGSTAHVRDTAHWERLSGELGELLALPGDAQQRVALLAIDAMAASWVVSGSRPAGLATLTDIVETSLRARIRAASNLRVRIRAPWSMPHSIRAASGDRTVLIPLDLVPAIIGGHDLGLLDPACSGGERSSKRVSRRPSWEAAPPAATGGRR